MLSGARRQALQAAAEKFHGNLDEHSWGYLRERGVSAEMAEQFMLGVVSADAGPTYDQFVGRLSIPYLTPAGVVSIRYRCIENHDCKDAGHPKYLQGKGEADHLYNVGALHERHPAVAVTEGEIDAMFADLIIPSLGVPGATKWKKHWTRLFEDHAKVFVLGDGDQAGREFADKLCELLPNAQAVVFPAGLDVNGFYLEHGPEGLERFILGDDAT